MTIVAREMSITYGGFTIGGASAVYLLHDVHRISQSYNSFMLEASVVVIGASEAAFVTNYQAVEAAFRKPRQALTVVLGSTSRTYQSSDGTAFNARGTIGRPSGGSEFDSARSRLYNVTVELDLPADLSGDAALREKSIEVKQMATGQRIVQIAGVYTASGSTSARAQYEAQIAALLASIKSDLSITEWDTLEEEAATDFQDYACTFRITTKEIIFDEGAGVVNVAAIKDHRIALTRTELGPGDSDASVVRPIEMAVVYECRVDKAETQDLRELYDDTVFPYLINIVSTMTGSSLIAVKRNSPTFEKAENRISATIEMTVFSGTPLLASFTTTTDANQAPIKLVPVWDGDPHAKYVMPAAGHNVRSVRTETLSYGGMAKSAQPAAASGGDYGMGMFDLNAGPFALDPAALDFGIFGGGALNIVFDAPPSGKKGGGGGGGGGGAVPAAQAPPPGPPPSKKGRYVPVRKTTETSPVVEGIAPYQVTLTREIVQVDAVYVVDPSETGGSSGGTAGGEWVGGAQE